VRGCGGGSMDGEGFGGVEQWKSLWKGAEQVQSYLGWDSSDCYVLDPLDDVARATSWWQGRTTKLSTYLAISRMLPSRL